MSGTHNEAVLKKLTKIELIQLLLKSKAYLGSQIADLLKQVKDTLTHFKKLEADTAAVRTVNDRHVERHVKTRRPCRKNAQYFRRDTLKIIGVPNSVDNSVVEETVRDVFKKLVLKLTCGMLNPVVV